MTQSELEFTPLNEQRILFLMDFCKETQHRITSCTNSVVNTERWNSEHFAENIIKTSLSKQLTETSVYGSDKSSPSLLLKICQAY